MIPWLFFFVGLPLILLAPVHAEILVYKSSVNRWSSTLIQNGTKSAWVKAPRGSKMDAYSLYYLDGTSRILPAPMMTYRGGTFKPYVIYVDHKLKTKQITGATPANEASNTEQTFYGRSRGPGGQRIFRMLYQQWEPNPDGSYDTAVSVGEGPCQILNVGGGTSGYYAPKISGQGWRMDGRFVGPSGPYQDGLQLFYLASSSDLDLATTKAINDNALALSEAFAYVIQVIFPSYKELSPNIR